MADFVGANDPNFASIYSGASTPATGAPGTVTGSPDPNVPAPGAAAAQGPLAPAAPTNEGNTAYWQQANQRLLAGETPYGVLGGAPQLNDVGPEATLPGPAYAGTVSASALTPEQVAHIAYNTPAFQEWAKNQPLDILYGTVNNLQNAYRFNAYAGNPADLQNALNNLIDLMVVKQNQATGAMPGSPGYVTRDQLVSGMGAFRNTAGNQAQVGSPYQSLYPMANGVMPTYGGATNGAPTPDRAAQLMAAAQQDRKYAANLATTDPAKSKMYADRAAQYEQQASLANQPHQATLADVRAGAPGPQGAMGFTPTPGTPMAGTLPADQGLRQGYAQVAAQSPTVGPTTYATPPMGTNPPPATSYGGGSAAAPTPKPVTMPASTPGVDVGKLTQASAADRKYAANLAASDPAKSKMYLDRANEYDARIKAAGTTTTAPAPSGATTQRASV